MWETKYSYCPVAETKLHMKNVSNTAHLKVLSSVGASKYYRYSEQKVKGDGSLETTNTDWIPTP